MTKNCEHKKTCSSYKLCNNLNYCIMYQCAENFREVEQCKKGL